jgi:hypothetical protein
VILDVGPPALGFRGIDCWRAAAMLTDTLRRQVDH